MAAKIQLVDLVKEFGRVRAVDHVSMEIEEGEFLILVGPSGCGKTTTLNCISGLETPTEGRVIIDGQVVNDVEPGKRGLGIVFQSLALFPHMTIFENIGFGLMIKRVDRDVIRQKVIETSKALRIPHLLHKKPAQLSGGEAQRAALARTVITEPSIFLMDEPLSSLDAKLRIEMRTELKRLHETLKPTFVYVTHDQAEAMTMADRITVMNQGVINQIGAPLEIYNNPKNLFVASFFGTPIMNFIEGVITRKDQTYVFSGEEFRLELDPIPRKRLPLPENRPLVLGVRAENVRLRPEGIRSRVELTEPLGDETVVHLNYGEKKSLISKVDSSVSIHIDDQVNFALDQHKVYFFDRETGARIG